MKGRTENHTSCTYFLNVFSLKTLKEHSTILYSTFG